MKNTEWFTIEVRCKHTDIKLVPDVVAAISHLLRGWEIDDHEITHFWGDEPGAATKRHIDKAARPR